MKTKEDFIKTFVKIEFSEKDKCYGYYPFQLVATLSDDKIEMNALLLGGDVFTCYMRFKEYIKRNSKSVYMAIDFPAANDIDSDFVAVFSYENGKYGIIAIPYSTETGIVEPMITSSKHLDNILTQFLMVVNS